MEQKIKDIVSQMTLEEKSGMCSGADFWHLKSVERLGIPRTMVTDGPHGLRKQDDSGDHLGINDSIKAVCFPTAVGMASSFDRDAITRLGEVLGEECQAENVSVLLGPAVNIKRSPLCGRNFEYLSEDPYLTGQLATAYIKGVQSKNVGTSIKHFALNNQETRRMTSSSNVDERTMREIYLSAFETVVKEADPWTIMSSYNRINGEFASENNFLLNDVLRDEWGFKGYAMTDWSGTNDRVKGLAAGQDLEMPSSGGINDAKIVAAVKDGTLDENILDTAVARILNTIFRYENNRDKTAVFDRDAHHLIAKEMAHDAMVLLKNNNNILPLNPASNIAFIGKFAAEPRFQGSGSSHINAHKLVGALQAAKTIPANIVYAQGYNTEKDEVDETLQAQAVKSAKDADVAVMFVGLPGSFESEGFDRSHMDMPNAQNKLIEEVLKVQKNVVIVLHNGSPITMPWLNDVSAVLESYLGGQAVGEAQVDILFGKANPSGKLAETFPIALCDNPSYLNYPGEGDVVNYAEGVFVGYRYYDKKKMNVLFPFGFGLSYTTFEYSNLKISETTLKDKNATITVSVDVKNTGAVAGKESVQLYVAQKNSPIIRPDKELKNFGKVSLEAGETKTITMQLNARSFAYYNTAVKDWTVLPGEYDISIGKSCMDIALCASVTWDLPPVKGFRVHDNTTMGDLFAHPVTAPIIQGFMQQAMQKIMPENGDGALLGDSGNEMMQAMMKDMPMRSIRNFGGKDVATIYPQIMAKMNGDLEASDK